MGVGAVDASESDLFEVVLALGAGGGLAHFLDGGQEQADQDGDDGDYHQQLNQRETTPMTQETEPRHKEPPR